MNSKEVGDFGEKTARNYLEKKRYKILETNFKKKWGEIDIIAKKQGKIIFVEVKTLRRAEQAEDKAFIPEDEIDWKKKKQLRKMTQIYLSENKISLNRPYQIDIIAVEISPDFQKACPELAEGVKIRHYKNAIEDIY